jgi:hypothetical protein
MLNQELWKDIPEFEGVYQISNFGRLKSFKIVLTGRVLSNKEKSGKYFSVVLKYKGKIRYVRMHRLVAEAFIPNPENKPAVNHKDLNKQNNRVDNLEWATNSENCRHAIEHYPNYFAGINYYNKFVRPLPICQYTLEGKFIKSYPNAAEASKATGVCQRNILQVAMKTEYKPGKTRKQAGGYIWRADD